MIKSSIKRDNLQKKASVFSVGILSLSLSLVFASVYLFVKSKSISIQPTELSDVPQGQQLNNDSMAWETFRNEEFGYSLEYPPLLEPRTIETDNYLSFIIFFVPEGARGSGFAASVRENNLDMEVELIKEEIGKDVSAKLVKEEQIEEGEYLGKRLKYEPQDSTEGEPRVIVILNNGKYSYTISSTPEQIGKIFSSFEFIE